MNKQKKRQRDQKLLSLFSFTTFQTLVANLDRKCYAF